MPLHRILTAAILLLAAGGLGGSFQPSRLILIAGFAFAIFSFIRQLRKAHRLEALSVTFGLLTLLLGALTMFWTPDLMDGAGLWITVAVGFLAFTLVIASDKTVDFARELRYAWSFAFAATIPFALYEIITDNHFLYALDERDVGGDYGTFRYASVFFGNYNNYCVFICLALPMLFGSLDQSRLMRAKSFWLGVISAAYLILVVNTSRAALIAGFVVLVFYLITRRSTTAVGVLGASTLVLGATAYIVQDDLYRLGRLASLRARGLIEGDESIGQRWDLIRFGIERLEQTWGFGGGVGAFEAEVSTWQFALIPNAHNFLLELAVNFTIYALLLFIWFMVAMFRGALQSKAPSDIRFIPLIGIPLMPLIGALNSQAIGYTYWWIWIATLLFMVVAGSPEKLAARARSGQYRGLASVN